MKTLTLAFLAFASVLAVAQTNPTPPPILTFAPGSSWTLAGVAVPGSKSIKAEYSACISTPFASLPFGTSKMWSLQSDLLGGVNLVSHGLTAGYDATVRYSAPIHGTQFVFTASLGLANLFGTGLQGHLGGSGSIGISIPAK